MENQSIWSKLLLFTALVLIIFLGSILITIKRDKSQTSGQKSNVYQPTLTPTQIGESPNIISTTNPTTNPTVNWKTYTNVEGYSIKYPASFTTLILAAGASNKEAIPTTRNFFIYKSNTLQPYLDRYINLEIFDLKPSHYQATITKEILDSHFVEKSTYPDAKFDIYSAQLSDKGFIEIHVSTDPTRKEVANQILSTFKFTN